MRISDEALFFKHLMFFWCLFIICMCKLKFTPTVVVSLFSPNGSFWFSENKCRMWLPVSTSRKRARKGDVCCRWIYFLVCRNITLRNFFTDLTTGTCWWVRRRLTSMDQFEYLIRNPTSETYFKILQFWKTWIFNT